MKQGQKQSKEGIRKMVETRKRNGSYVAWNKGKSGIYSKKTLQKMSDGRKALFQNGWIHPLKGKHPSEETLKKMKIANLGKKHTKETKRKISISGKGKHFNENTHLITWKRILEEASILESQGYRVIPITKVIPDIIAIKNGRVFAFEVEYKNANNPNIDKYTEDIKKYFDEVVWLIRKRK